MVKPDLRVVDADGGTHEVVVDMGAEFRRLFRRERDLEARLAETREAIQKGRKRYAVEHDLLMLPRVERLREQFGAKP